MPTGTAQADGSMKVESTFDVDHVVSTVVYNVEPAAGHERPVRHDHGDGHALHWTGVAGPG